MLKDEIEIISARKYCYQNSKTGEEMSGTKVYYKLKSADVNTIGEPVKVQDMKDNYKIWDELASAGLTEDNSLPGYVVFGRNYYTEKLEFMKFEFGKDLKEEF